MPTDPASLAKTIASASKVASTPFFTTVIDKLTGFRISKWAAEGEVRKKAILDEYEKAKESGIMGVQYIENLRSTQNLIDVAVKTTKYIDPNKPNEIQMDNDFFWNTLEHAKTVSNDEVQELIAKIIAGEYSEQGSYSMATLQILKMLGKNELELLEKFGSLCLDNEKLPRDLFSKFSEIISPFLNTLDVNFESFQYLQSLGLFYPNHMTSRLESDGKKLYYTFYIGKMIGFEPILPLDFIQSNIPNYYKITYSGSQILKHLNLTFHQEYYNFLIKNYKIHNYKVV